MGQNESRYRSTQIVHWEMCKDPMETGQLSKQIMLEQLEIHWQRKTLIQPHTHTKVNSKWIINTNLKTKSKSLNESIEEYGRLIECVWLRKLLTT